MGLARQRNELDIVVNLTKGLLERRVPHVLVIYAGGCWGLVEFVAFLVDEFLLSPHWPRVAMAALLLLLPSVAMLAWFHGRPGRDDVPLAEKIGIPVNLGLAAAILVFFFGRADLGAATTTVLVETEDGEEVERVVPKPEFRRRTALFAFDAGPQLGEDEDWLTYMAPVTLVLDLAADDFFEPVPLDAFIQRLSELGFPTLRDVPLSLKREISQEFHAAFIAAGTVDREAGRYRITLTVHETARASLVSETVHEGEDFLALIDEMSEVLADELKMPDRPDIEDLPVRERLTRDDAAWEAYGRGYAKLLVEPRGYSGALEEFSLATTADPTFTLAQYELSMQLMNDNRPEAAVAPIQAALDNLYRLPERMRFGVKADYYFMTQQVEKASAVLAMWTELHPEDPAALRDYASVQEMNGDWEGLLATLGTLHQLRPDEHSLLTRVAWVREAIGDDAGALAALIQYVQRLPNDYTGYLNAARFSRRRGEHGAARDYLERAIIIEPLVPELASELAWLDLLVGRFDDALAGYERALELARTFGQRAAALRGLQAYYVFRGRMEEAIRTADVWLEEVSGSRPAAEIAQQRFFDIDVYIQAARYDDAVALLEELKSQLPPWLSDLYVPYWDIQVALAGEHTDAARAAYRVAVAAMEANGFGAGRPALIAELGRIEELDGEHALAVHHYRDAMSEDPNPTIHRRLGRTLRKVGRLDEAEEELRESLRVRPADPRVRLELAQVLEARGDTAGAVQHLVSALAAWELADESYEPAREARSMLAALVSASRDPTAAARR